jgi:hypothetical protein
MLIVQEHGVRCWSVYISLWSIGKITAQQRPGFTPLRFVAPGKLSIFLNNHLF